MTGLEHVTDEKLEEYVGIICRPGFIPTVAEPGCPRVARLIAARESVWAEVVRRGERNSLGGDE